jgi:hypothetical protein
MAKVGWLQFVQLKATLLPNASQQTSRPFSSTQLKPVIVANDLGPILGQAAVAYKSGAPSLTQFHRGKGGRPGAVGRGFIPGNTTSFRSGVLTPEVRFSSAAKLTPNVQALDRAGR